MRGIWTHVPNLARGRLGQIPLTLADFSLGATPPTATTIGTTPTLDTLRFDATAETANVFIAMPPDWDKAADCAFELYCALTTTEVTADEISLSYDYTAVLDRTTAGGAGKTSTAVTLTHDVLTANGLAAGDVYLLSRSLAAADASNGWAPGDATVGLAIEFHMTNLTEVAALDLLGGRLTYTRLY